MPKVLVMFSGWTKGTAALADAIAEGAESVRFTEVELRRIEDPALAGETDADEATRSERAMLMKKYRPLESAGSLVQYDALIIGGITREGEPSRELVETLDGAAVLGERALADKVGSAFGRAPAAARERELQSLLTPLMRLGMIIVPPDLTTAHAVMDDGAPGAEELAAARRHGARVAKVAEWVRHAKSHEAHGHTH